jgi:hypothetical protein
MSSLQPLYDVKERVQQMIDALRTQPGAIRK